MMMTKKMRRIFLYDGTFDDDDDDDDDNDDYGDDIYCWTVVLMIYVLFEIYIECINKQNNYCTVTDDD